MTGKSAILFATLLLAANCGESGPGDQEVEPDVWQNVKPSLLLSSPGSLAVGEELTVLGQDFIAPDKGKVIIRFEGTFFDDQGQSYPVSYQGDAVRQSGTKLSWKLWPHIVFHPTGDRLGYFLGDITLVNSAKDGSQLVSDRFPATLNITPSLLPRQVQPLGSQCQPVVTHTLEGKGFAFSAEAIGLRPATAENPITFLWTFMSQHWEANVSFNTFDTTSIFPDQGPVVFQDIITEGLTSSIRDGGNKSYVMKVLSDLNPLSDVYLRELKTKAIEGAGAVQTTINVAATDSSGKSVTLAIPLNIGRMAELIYDGQSQLAERYPPVPVTDCIYGQEYGGTQVSYTEDKAEVRSRSLGFRYDASGGLSISPFPANPFALGLNFNIGFGVDVNGTVSSQKSQGLNVGGIILPAHHGMFYRQTTRVYRVGHILGRTECGQVVDLGEAIVQDWLFTPEFQAAQTCPPPSHLPPAEKFLD